MQETLVKFMRKDKPAANRILSAYLNLLIAYPDQPYGHKPIMHPADGRPIVTPPDAGNIERLLPKDETAFEIALRKVGAGENVLIYTNWTRLDTAEKLKAALTDAGVNTCVLSAKVKPSAREDWIAKHIENGLRVLITNPTIVETGLDLNAFTTLIFYDVGLKLFTMRQASRRSWRINQTAPRVEVYMLYYANTMQHKLLKLMGTKLAVAAIIEGGFSDEGLAAMSQCEDMTAMMAKELMLGIRDSVEDVSASFKRMAVTKPAADSDAGFGDFDIFTDIKGSPPEEAIGIEMPEFTFAGTDAPDGKKSPVAKLPTHAMPAKRKVRFPDENQIDFFEHIA
jgi:hypothetical protein